MQARCGSGEPNYAIKRDLRGNPRFMRVIIRRVGPLFWLLDGLELFDQAFHISRLLLISLFSSATRQLTAACAGLACGVSSSAFQHPVVQARPKVLFISCHPASRLVFQQSRHRHYLRYAFNPSQWASRSSSFSDSLIGLCSNDAIKGTSVEIVDSSERSSGASVPYLGC